MNKYLVTYEIDGEVCEPVIETAAQIFDKMGMDDCYDIRIRNLLWLKKYSSPEEIKTEIAIYPPCFFKGTWHNTSTPLLMEIVMMFDERRVLDSALAPDH